MTTNTPIQNGHSKVDFFEEVRAPAVATTSDVAHSEVIDPVAVDLARAGISFTLMDDERARAVTDARQRSLDEHPFAPLAEGLGAPLIVPQPVASEVHSGQSYVTYAAPRTPEEPSAVIAVISAGVRLLQDFGRRIADGPIGSMFRGLGSLIDRLEDKNTEELSKIHPLLGSGLGPSMTDADIPRR